MTEPASRSQSDARFETFIARVAKDLSQPLVPVTPETTNTLVYQYLVKRPSLETLAVVRDGVPIGLINRHSFMEGYGCAFGRELFGREGCTTFMFEPPLIVDENLPVEALVKAALDDGGGALKDGFIVTRQGEYLGMGSGVALVHALSEIDALKTPTLASSLNDAKALAQSHLALAERALAASCPDYGLRWPSGGDGAGFYFRRTSSGLLGCLFDGAGQGVSGAFMALLVRAFLDNYFDAPALKEGMDPGVAVTQLHQYLRRVMQQRDDAAHEAASAGLEALMFTYDEGSSTLHYAGSTLALMLVNSEGELLSAPAGTAGIGANATPAEAVWTSHAVAVSAGSVVAIATDGTLRQLGGAQDFATGNLGVFIQQHRHQSAPALLAAILRRDAERQAESQGRDDLRLLIFRPKP